MKKKIIFVLLAVLAVSFTEISYAQTQKAKAKTAATQKTQAKPVAQANPLIGTWNFNTGNAFISMTFTADKVVFDFSNDATEAKYEMKYKFSASPLTLEYTDESKKIQKLTMTYAIKGDKLTYRFLKTNNKPIPGLPRELSQNRTANGFKDGDIIATKDTRKEEEAARAEARVLVGEYIFTNMDNEVRIEFTEDKATFAAYALKGGQKHVYTMDYKFSKTPIILQYKDEKGKTSSITMSYKITDDKLTYRFLNAPANIDASIYQKIVNAAKGTTAPADMEATKREAH